ncbi:MAG: signal peptidase II [Fimbriimonadaceae bacterium]
MKPHFVRFSAVFAFFLIVDQVVKAWARGAAENVEGRIIYALWPGVFEFKLLYNRGIAFGMLQGMGVWLAPIAIAITLAAAYHVWRHPRESKVVQVGMALLASGAIGNVIDRIWLGKVTDMFWFRLIDFPVFNVADSCITVAAFLLVWKWGLDAFRHDASPASEGSSPHEAERPRRETAAGPSE